MMFKTFFLNSEYEFDHLGNCKIGGTLLDDKHETVKIKVAGEIIDFPRKHTALFTHYRFNPFFVDFDNVWFAEVKSKVLRLQCGHVPIFKKPIEMGYGFRMIPGFPQFAINETGDVISIRTGTTLSRSINPYGYPCVSVFDPDKEHRRDVAVHLLLARSFIHNSDPSSKIYVNHKDGIKLNISLTNLEWVTPTENNRHAIRTGLSDPHKSRYCTVHDLLTSETWDYQSVTKALIAHDINSTYYGKTKLINGQPCHRVYNKRFMITDLGETPIILTNNRGTIASRVPHTGPYEAIELMTGKTHVTETIDEMVSLTNVPYHHVRSIIGSVEPKTSRGFHFRCKSDKPWPTTFNDQVTLKTRSFEIENVDTGEKMSFASLTKLTKFFGSAKNTIYEKLKTDQIHRGWLIREITS